MSEYTTHTCPECGDVHLPPQKDGGESGWPA
jgi:uncharacterized OB-fold protein